MVTTVVPTNDGLDESGWGNSAPLALALFAVCASMLSMVNTDLVDAAVKPYIWGVALMFGGITQLVAGLIQLRAGSTFSGQSPSSSSPRSRQRSKGMRSGSSSSRTAASPSTCSWPPSARTS